MAARVPEIKELVRNYLAEHGPSRAGDIYNGIPVIRENYTRSGFNSILHNMRFVHERGFVRLETHTLDRTRAYPPYVLALLQQAAKGGISMAKMRRTEGASAEAKMDYMRGNGLLERKRVFVPSPKPEYVLTKKGELVKTELEQKSAGSVARR